jgi:hypothetical protein
VRLAPGSIRVVIATTEGPSVVQRIAEESPDVGSVVCLNGTTEALPISQAYDSFVRAPTGVIERAVGHPVFRADVSAPIEDGRSWQLGLFLAHGLAAYGRLARDDVSAAMTVWTTGEVTHGLAVAPVEHLERKLEHSRPALQRWLSQGERVVVLYPEANRPGFPLHLLPDGVEAHAVATVEAALGLVDDGLLRRLRLPAPPGNHGPRPWRLAVPVLVCALAVAAILAWVWRAGQPPHPPPSLADNASPPAAVAADPPVAAVAAAPDADPVTPPAIAALPVAPQPEPKPAAVPAEPSLVLEIAAIGANDSGPCAGGAAGSVLALAPGCRVAAHVRNVGDGAARVGLSLVLLGDFRSYTDRNRYRAERTADLAPGARLTVEVAPPGWVRQPFEAEALAAVMPAEGNAKPDPAVVPAGAEAGLAGVLRALEARGARTWRQRQRLRPE